MPETFLTDGSFSFEGGVDSSRVTTLQSSLVPNGLPRNMLAWMDNATVRGGQILQRTGWVPNGRVRDGNCLFQGGFMYEPVDGSNPYLIFALSGHIYKYVADLGTVTDLSSMFPGMTMTPTQDQYWFCQGEQFLIIQDSILLPLFWDGAKLRRSIGIVTNTPSNTFGQNEIPVATAMDYYQSRLWYAQGRRYSAGDIVGGPSASGTYPFGTDSILEVTENPLAFGGDGFSVPNNAGNIRVITHAGNINAQLGEGQLFISTRKSIYAQYVPVSRANWISSGNSASGATDMPVQTVVQKNNGWVNDRSVVAVNSDLFGQSLVPAIQSLTMAVRNFGQWYNGPISNNENRALAFNNRALMRFSSGILFDNRLWESILPTQLPQGVIHQGVLPLDFDIISDFESQYTQETQTPAWEGMYQGLQILQLFTGDFGGLERAFAVVVSALDSSIEVWEMTTTSRTDGADSRVVWDFETPAYTFGDERSLKRLLGGELWISKLFGTVDVQVFYRPDSDPCYRFRFEKQICAARSCAEDELNPACSPFAYPVPPTYREGYRWPLALPKPPQPCDNQGQRPSDVAFQFQVRVVIKGWCSVRTVLLYADKFERGVYQGLKC